MLAPGVLFLLAFVAYPFFYGIYLSLQDRPVARAGVFVGLAKLRTLLGEACLAGHAKHLRLHAGDDRPQAVAACHALVINQSFRARNLVRAVSCCPSSCRDPPHDRLDVDLRPDLQLSTGRSSRRSREHRLLVAGNATCHVSIICQHVAGIPFYASRSSPAPDDFARSLRAAAIDVQRHPRFCTYPAHHQAHPDHRDDFSVIFTFATSRSSTRSPTASRECTQVFVTYAFDLGMSGQLGMGAAAALTLLPALALVIVVLALYLEAEYGRGGLRRAAAAPVPAPRVLPRGHALSLLLMFITSIQAQREALQRAHHAADRASATLKHYVDLLTQTISLTWTYKHHAGGVVTTRSPSCSHDDRTRWPACVSPGGRGGIGVAATYLVPHRFSSFHGRHHQPPRARQHPYRRHAHVSDAPHPVLRVLLMGYFKSAPRARGGGAHRRASRSRP